MEVNPEEVDVNIHPAKTEVKIENEQMIFQILHAAVREALGKNALGPSIDFDTEGMPSIPPIKRGLFVPPPKIDYDPLFNPFLEERFAQQTFGHEHHPVLFEPAPEVFTSTQSLQVQQPQILQFKEKYLLTPVKSGLMLIHIQRASQRIRYEHYLNLIANNGQESQQTLFPQQHTLDPASVMALEEARELLMQMGFDIRSTGQDCVTVYGLPVGHSTENEDVAAMLDQLVTHLIDHTAEIQKESAHHIALSLAMAECRTVANILKPNEAAQFVDKLFGSAQPATSPLGKSCMHIFPTQEFDKMFH